MLSWTRVYLTPYLSSRSAISGGTRLATATVLPFSGAFSLPVMLVGHHHLGDLVRCEQLFELAVGHDLDGLRLLPPLLQDEDGEQGEQQVADVELGALFHRVEMGPKTLFSKQELDLKAAS